MPRVLCPAGPLLLSAAAIARQRESVPPLSAYRERQAPFSGFPRPKKNLLPAKHLFAALPPPVPTSHTIRQAVDQLKSEITNLRDRGYTLALIADHLNSAGIPVADSTLRNYASQPRRKRGKNAPRTDPKSPFSLARPPLPRRRLPCPSHFLPFPPPHFLKKTGLWI
jgi:hypothetical protein